MEGGNLLSGGVDTLNEIKEHILELHGYQSKHDTLILDEENLDKSIKALEKDIAEEIASITKKRRQEIDDTFDKQMDKTKARIRKTKEKRDKHKNMKMSERMEAETASLKEDNNLLKNEAKDLFQQRQVPPFCYTNLYYSLYFPSGIVDILVILCALVMTLFVIPCGIYYVFLPVEKTLYLIITYVITVLVFGGVYIVTGNNTKDQHMEVLKQVKKLKGLIKINQKKAAVIRRSIRKDRDESSYGLENFDEELAKLEREISDFTEQKKDALGVFDNSTSQVIASEIRGLYEEKLTAFKNEYEKVSSEVLKAEDKVKLLSIKIASDYEPFLGKDLMTLDRLEALINIIRAGSANTLSEALAVYKQEINTAIQK
ncbi:MAG: hypothetical protein K0S76_2675 [Herbinix sp.]|jgi:hypothetical protein|nr:hypothetical protein [Herbinix sp.]